MGFFFKLHFKIGQFPGILWISSFSGKLGRSGDPRPTDPLATITSLPHPGAGLVCLLLSTTTPAHFTHFFYFPGPCRNQVDNPGGCSGLSEKVSFLTPLHVHLQSVSLQGRPQFPLTFVSPVLRGCSFFDELSLRCGILSGSGSATVIKPQGSGKLQMFSDAGFPTGPCSPCQGG